jgi:hypothetical protein
VVEVVAGSAQPPRYCTGPAGTAKQYWLGKKST